MRAMKLTLGVFTVLTFVQGKVDAGFVDLSTWQDEGGGNWELQTTDNPNDSVLQTLNSPPTVFFNNQNSQGMALSGSITVQSTGDDDFIGFVLGYDAGDITGSNPTTDYVLVDWKQATQSGWDAGMSISRVTGSIEASGVDTNADAWDHDGNVDFIQRAATLGDVGWSDNTEYLFDIVFTSNNIKVSVDGVEQFDINGTFEDGSFGFYNFSQQTVLYAGITEDVVVPVPAPASLALLCNGIFGFAWIAWRRRRQVIAA